jgi:6-phosphogluconolactonase
MIRVVGDQKTLCEAAVDKIVRLAAAAVAERGRFMLAVSGGKTPEPLYELLAQSPWRERIDWTRVEVFWSDERCVPPESSESNFRLVHESLLSKLDPVPRAVHRIEGEGPDRDRAAEAYEDEIRLAFGARRGEGPPSFDLVLLGMGADGHTASLFPHAPALGESVEWVVSSRAPAPPHDRITMTLPLLNRARTALFLVAGAEKSAALAAVLSGSGHDPLPARRVAPEHGELLWLVDRAAASSLPDDSVPSRVERKDP